MFFFSDWRFELPPKGWCWFWTEGGRSPRDPLKHMLLVLSPSSSTKPRPVCLRSLLMADKVKGHVLSHNGFSTAVHRNLHEHMTNNHSDTKLGYEVIPDYSLWCFPLCFVFPSFSQLLLAFASLSFNKHLLYSRNILSCLLHPSCSGANNAQLSLSHVSQTLTKINYERQLLIADGIIINIWEFSLLNPGQLISLDLINFFILPRVKITI